MTCVTASVPARLHLGFLDLNGSTGRRFGSLGLPLSEPETLVSLTHASKTIVEGSDSARASRHLEELCRHLGITTHHRLVIHRAIPPHIGLGSGTQMAMAVSAALRRFHGLDASPGNDALLLGRGSRSGIGIAAFSDGGLIVDAGRKQDDAEPPVVARHPFPDQWRVILILDHTNAVGLHGEDEISAFRQLPPFPLQSAGEICRRVLMQALPAVIENDFGAFGEAVETIQIEMGTYFAPAQGGLFTSQNVERVAMRLRELGARGIGQSSWGPTGFVFAPSELDARRFIREAQDSIEEGIELRIVRGRNRGALITEESDQPEQRKARSIH